MEQCVQLLSINDAFGNQAAQAETVTTLCSNHEKYLGGNQGPSKANLTYLHQKVTPLALVI